MNGRLAELMRERYARFGRGEVERALDLWADDFVREGDSAGLPGRIDARDAKRRWAPCNRQWVRGTRSR